MILVDVQCFIPQIHITYAYSCNHINILFYVSFAYY